MLVQCVYVSYRSVLNCKRFTYGESLCSTLRFNDSNFIGVFTPWPMKQRRARAERIATARTACIPCKIAMKAITCQLIALRTHNFMILFCLSVCDCIYLSCATNTFIVCHIKTLLFFLSLSLRVFSLQGEWNNFFSIHAPSCRYHYAWSYTKALFIRSEFNFMPIFLFKLFARIYSEHVLKKFSSGTRNDKVFMAFGTGEIHCYGWISTIWPKRRMQCVEIWEWMA